ncbi:MULTISPECIES: hypothetical protein [unclassified Sediminibacterium]|jgi:hypothetical protein|uniref:hypothetical protein n=1 Tax=unclassified Sediminibacterium TaxID=2635961 RepID=UPI002203A602|nr:MULTISPECIES: hypothetical protein [unclassified Sediminibacterium]BDQ12108.1 hypothetical protein TEGAF0_13250 [Sediminibacterium sp. TEGAF015]
MKQNLTIEKLIEEAQKFCKSESTVQNTELYGVTDGKKVGTHVEHKFKDHLLAVYDTIVGSSASGIDLPSENILTDIKVTSINKPQSSCPYKDAKQKIFGLGYNLLVFVYDKKDDSQNQTSILDFVSCSFVPAKFTGDYSTTRIINDMKRVGSSTDDIVAFLTGINLPADDSTKELLAKQILETEIQNGCLTISNALQWRLSYSWICPNREGKTKPLNNLDGVHNIIHKVTEQ